MSFADCLKLAQRTTAPTPPVRRALWKALLGVAGLAALPLLSRGGSLTGQALRTTVALALASGLAFWGLKLLARRTRAAGPAALRVVARSALSQRNSLAIVEADGQRYFIAYGEGFTALLSAAPSRTGPEAPAHGGTP